VLLRLLAGEGEYLVLESEVARREIREELDNADPNTVLFRDFAAADVRLNPERVSSAERFGTPRLEEEESAPVVDITALRPAQNQEGGAESAPADEADDGVIGHIELANFGFGDSLPETDMEASEEPEARGQLDVPWDEPAEAAQGAPQDEPSPEEDGDPDLVDQEDDGGSESGSSAEAEEVEEAPSCHWCRQTLPGRDLLNFCPFCGSDMRLSPCPKCGEELEPGWQYYVSCGTDVGE